MRVSVSQNVVDGQRSVVHGLILHVIYLGMPSEPLRHKFVPLMEPNFHKHQTIRDIYRQPSMQPPHLFY